MKRYMMDTGKLVVDNASKPKDLAQSLARFNLSLLWHGRGGNATPGGVKQYVERLQFGPSPFSKDWDLLVVLDTCRADALQAVADEYEWLPDRIQSTRSPASWSKAWLQKAANPEKYGDVMQDTHCVAWNPFTEYESSPAEWHTLEEPWRDGRHWNPDEGLPPRVITDRVIRAGRDSDASRVFAWYQQPHAPYPTLDVEEPLAHEDVGRLDVERETVWDACIAGTITRDDAWQAMLANLRRVLDDVELLLSNYDAERVVLTADHGEAFGELGGLLWGHGGGMPHPALIRVPWVELTARDAGTYTPAVDARSDYAERGDVSSRLEALGYV